MSNIYKPTVEEMVFLFGKQHKGFWINDDDYSEWFDDIKFCPYSGEKVVCHTWNAQGEFVLEI